MISKKVCLLGAFSVGKTALVQRYVYSIFSGQYKTTLGVQISKKVVTVDNQDVSLILWDLEGKDDFTGINFSYLRGAMGVILVADGTRKETLEVAISLRERALELVGQVPHILLINKFDLAPTWEVSEEQLQAVEELGILLLKTSAKTGGTVDEAFSSITRAMLR